MAKVYIRAMSVYGIRQFSVCCHGKNFAKTFASSLLLTASISLTPRL